MYVICDEKKMIKDRIFFFFFYEKHLMAYTYTGVKSDEVDYYRRRYGCDSYCLPAVILVIYIIF